MFESVDSRKDAQTPARVPSYKLILIASGSAELKMQSSEILHMVCESKVNFDFDGKIWSVNSVSIENLHGLDIICLASVVCSQPKHRRTGHFIHISV